MDISGYSYDEWLNFTFSHDVEDPAWHFSDDWEYEFNDPPRLISYLTRLFADPEVLLSKFTVKQIDQGLWFIPGPNGYLWTWLDSSIPVTPRTNCVLAVRLLFDKLFASHNIGTSAHMWWDSVFSYCVLRGKSLDGDPDILDAVAEVIVRQANDENPVIRCAGMHGVEHLARLYRASQDGDVRAMIEACVDRGRLEGTN